MDNWKIQKVRAINKEVDEFHPLLDELFRRIPEISNVEYNQGPHEMGADFVLAKNDSILDIEEYIGVIVKIGGVKQNQDDIERQINECSMERKFMNGKKSIFLSEIWIVCNGDISHNAEQKIHHNFKDKKIKFLDAAHVAKLIEKHIPSFWENVGLEIGTYLESIERGMFEQNQKSSLLDPSLGGLYIEQDIVKICSSKYGINKPSKNRKISVDKLIDDERFILIEGEMGAGKSRLLREMAIRHSQRKSFSEKKVFPIYKRFDEFFDEFSTIANVFDFIQNNLKTDPTEKTILLLLDALDEATGDFDEKQAKIAAIVQEANTLNNVRIIITSRYLHDPSHESNIDRILQRYQLRQLTMSQIVTFVGKICDKYNIKNRIANDFHKSAVFKALPRTPIAAILLAKLLSEDIKELPSTLPELYSKYTELSLGRWDLAKGLNSEKEYQAASALIKIAAKYYIDNNLNEVAISELKSMFVEYSSKRETGVSADKLFESIIERSELLCQDRYKGTIYFKHRTFAEFFYAQNVFSHKGLGADFDTPFAPSWAGIVFFYLGFAKDSPELISKLRRYIPNSEGEQFYKIVNMSNYLLAAYHTPYNEISDAVRDTIIDAAKTFSFARNNTESQLKIFSEMHLLAILTQVIRDGFEYSFFKKAIDSALIEIEDSSTLTQEEKNVALFLAESVRAGLGDLEAFSLLGAKNDLPLLLQLAVDHSADDANFSNDIVKKMNKRVIKNVKNNKLISSFISELYTTPLRKRKDILANQRD